MSLETRKVLEMLAEGKLSAADAEKLLDKLQAGAGSGAEQMSAAAPAPESPWPRRVRFLRIVVDEPGRKPVNIRMPLAFAFARRSLLGVLPTSVTEKLKERGIDLDQIRNCADTDKLFQELNLEVDKGDGKKVRIYCE